MQRKTKPINSILLVVVLAAAATACRFALIHWLGYRTPALFYTLAIMICAQLAGTAASLALTGLSIVVLKLLFLGTPYAIHFNNPQDMSALLLFAVIGVAISVMGGRERRYRNELEREREMTALKHEVARMGSFEWFVKEGRMQWSPEMEKLYGIRSHDQVHTIEDWKARVHSEDLGEALEEMEETARLRRPTYDQTYRILRADGEVRWIHTRRKYQYDAHGQPEYVIGIDIDVTDLERGAIAQQLLGGFVEVCSACRRIHETKSDEWLPMENYLHRHNDTRVSHGMCTECGQKWLAQMVHQ